MCLCNRWVLPFISTDLQGKGFVWTGKGSCKKMLEQGQCLSDCWAALSLQSEWQSEIEITELQPAEGSHVCEALLTLWGELLCMEEFGWDFPELRDRKRGTLGTMPLTTLYCAWGFFIFSEWNFTFQSALWVAGEMYFITARNWLSCASVNVISINSSRGWGTKTDPECKAGNGHCIRNDLNNFQKLTELLVTWLVT